MAVQFYKKKAAQTMSSKNAALAGAKNDPSNSSQLKKEMEEKLAKG